MRKVSQKSAWDLRRATIGTGTCSCYDSALSISFETVFEACPRSFRRTPEPGPVRDTGQQDGTYV